MRKIFFSLILCIGIAAQAKTYDYPYLTFEGTDGAVVSVEVEGLTLTVSDTDIIATETDGSTYTFTLASLDKMYFADEADGILPLSTDSDEEVEAYNTDGTKAGKFSNAAAAKAALRQGVYILKGKSVTFKISLP